MQSGTYSLDARAVVQHRHKSLGGQHTLGLLVTPPTPEGAHAVELDVPGYIAPAIHFGPPVVIGGAVRSGNRASFGAIGDALADVTHAAIFDLDRCIIAYGPVQRAPGTAGPAEIAFEPGAIRVRF